MRCTWKPESIITQRAIAHRSDVLRYLCQKPSATKWLLIWTHAQAFSLHAGYVVLSICNLTLILILGLMDTDAAPKQPANSAYSNSVPPHTQPTYPPRG